jgi:hypothetical protein
MRCHYCQADAMLLDTKTFTTLVLRRRMTACTFDDFLDLFQEVWAMLFPHFLCECRTVGKRRFFVQMLSDSRIPYADTLNAAERKSAAFLQQYCRVAVPPMEFWPVVLSAAITSEPLCALGMKILPLMAFLPATGAHSHICVLSHDALISTTAHLCAFAFVCASS